MDFPYALKRARGQVGGICRRYLWHVADEVARGVFVFRGSSRPIGQHSAGSTSDRAMRADVAA